MAAGSADPPPTGPLDPAALPALRTAVPGPASVALGQRLRRVESRNVTRVTSTSPIFWSSARGAAVRDADGNVFVDLTAGFGVAHAGHADPAVAAAIAAQAAILAHGLGDVHPPDIKVELLEALARITPGDLGVSILGGAGAEAVEAALKTALLQTGRAGILAFEGAYHGLTLGALAVTHRTDFRAPFEAQLNPHVSFAPYPSPGDDVDAALAGVRTLLAAAADDGVDIGAIIIEPMLGRGGLVTPPAGFLAGLRALCDGRERVLIFDEIYTGAGRTGRWFACEHEAVVPDIVCVGKALSGSIALSAAVGTAAVMEAWPESTGEAIHTSTFLGNPVACAAAIAQIRHIEDARLLERAAEVGEAIRRRTAAWTAEIAGVEECRGRGLLQGVVLAPPAPSALEVADAALRAGVIVLAEGPRADVLALTPPAVITSAQLTAALDTIERLLRG